jgi:hypothetical protein
MALSLAACGGSDTDTPSGGNGTNPPASQGGSNNTPSGIIDIPHEDISVIGLDSDKEAILAEIPAELLKGVGESNFSQISNIGVLSGYKYTLLINLDTAEGQGEAELEKLMDYYRSIGGTVTEANNLLDDYFVQFDYAESVSCSALSSSIQLQFSVVKGVLTGEKDEALVLSDGQGWYDEYGTGYVFNADGTYSYYWGSTVTAEGTWYTSDGRLNMTESSAKNYTVSGDTLTLESTFGDAQVYTKADIPSDG